MSTQTNLNESVAIDRAAALADTPVKLDEEWANALTHGLAAVASVVLGAHLAIVASDISFGLVVACVVYAASVAGTFLCSTLSHSILRQPLLNHLRAWDQAMIYLMIAGTYSPIVFRYAPDHIRTPLMIALWVAALTGFVTKVAIRHRINSIGTVSYLLLGWLPSIPLAGHTPMPLAMSMLGGGVLYSLGVVFLLNDSKFRYAHAIWHVFVISAATLHWYGILYYVTV